jgi:hypothetical protein
MKTKIVLFLAVVVSTPLVTEPVFAHEMVLTEFSSTHLTATYDGTPLSIASIQLISPDNWTITFSFRPSQLGDSWFEPTGFTSNRVTPSANLLTVVSDSSSPPSTQNGFQSTVVFGFDLKDGAPIFVTFNDKSDVPDMGSTLGLLALALAALFGASRIRSLRLA